MKLGRAACVLSLAVGVLGLRQAVGEEGSPTRLVVSEPEQVGPAVQAIWTTVTQTAQVDAGTAAVALKSLDSYLDGRVSHRRSSTLHPSVIVEVVRNAVTGGWDGRRLGELLVRFQRDVDENGQAPDRFLEDLVAMIRSGKTPEQIKAALDGAEGKRRAAGARAGS